MNAHRNSPRPRGRPATSVRRLLSALAFITLSGCHTYRAEPLNLDSTRQAWLKRSPSDSGVADFAAALASREKTPASFDLADGITLAEAEVVALVFNRDLRIARLEAGVTRAAAAHAGTWEDPALGLDIERILSGAADPWVAGATIELTIPLSGRLAAERQHARAQLAAALQHIIAREWALRAAVRELWIEWSAQKLRHQVLSDLVEQLRTVVEVAAQQEQAGVLSRIDSRVFRVELAGDEADMIAAAARIQELELQLRDAMGLSPEAPLTLLPTVAYAPRTASHDRHTLESGNAELASVRAEYDLAEHALRVEVRKQYPDLALGPGFGSDQGDDRLLLGLRLPIALWNRNRQGVAESLAARDAARARFDGAYERLAMSLALAHRRFESGKAVRESVETRIVPLAEEQDAEVRRVAQLGRVDPLLILETVRSRNDAKLRLINARAAESIGAIRLDELLGPPQPPAQHSTGALP